MLKIKVFITADLNSKIASNGNNSRLDKLLNKLSSIILIALFHAGKRDWQSIADQHLVVIIDPM